MIDYNKEIVSVLKEILPVHYELTLTSNTKTPCISYQERNNYTSASGDTLGYSMISYTIKIWDKSIERIQKYSLLVDEALRSIGFKRISSGELADSNSAMIQKILTYEGIAKETY